MKKPKKQKPKQLTYNVEFSFIPIKEPEWYTLGYSSQKDMDVNYTAIGNDGKIKNSIFDL